MCSNKGWSKRIKSTKGPGRFAYENFEMKMVFSLNTFGGQYAEKILKLIHQFTSTSKCEYCGEIYWSLNMEALNLAKHNRMNFKTLITESEESIFHTDNLIKNKHLLKLNCNFM